MSGSDVACSRPAAHLPAAVQKLPVEQRRELDRVLAAAAGYPGPALVEVISDPDLI
jgi:hypothetical protein